MALENERRKQLVKSMVATKRRQIELNCACAHKSANLGEKPTPEELVELRAAIDASRAAHEALIDHLQNGSTSLETPAVAASTFLASCSASGAIRQGDSNPLVSAAAGL